MRCTGPDPGDLDDQAVFLGKEKWFTFAGSVKKLPAGNAFSFAVSNLSP